MGEYFINKQNLPWLLIFHIHKMKSSIALSKSRNTNQYNKHETHTENYVAENECYTKSQ